MTPDLSLLSGFAPGVLLSLHVRDTCLHTGSWLLSFFFSATFSTCATNFGPQQLPPLQAPGGTAGTSAWSLTAGGYGELPAHVGKDLVQSETGTSKFMSAKRTLRATRAPASWNTRATALSKGSARDASTPDVAHATLWSPSGCRWPRQAHVRGATGSGRRSRRSSKTLKCPEGTGDFARRGEAACGPTCDSSSARDAESRSEKCVSSARWSLAVAASRCHPCKKSQNSRSSCCAGGRCKDPQAGGSNPCMRRQAPHGARQEWARRRLPRPAGRQPGGRRRQGLACGWLVNSQPKRPNRRPGRSQQLTANPARRIAAASAKLRQQRLRALGQQRGKAVAHSLIMSAGKRFRCSGGGMRSR